MFKFKFLLFLSFFLFNVNQGISQAVVYICTSNGQVHQVDMANCSTTLVSSGNGTNLTDIAYSSLTGSLFAVDDFANIYEINISTGAISFFGAINVFGTYDVTNSLTCDDNGILYIAAYNGVGLGGYMYTYDITTNTTVALGTLPPTVEPAGDLTFLNGQLVLTTYSNELYAINLANPSLSTPLGAYQGIANVYGIISLDCGEEAIVTSGSQMYSLDTVTFQTTLLCSLPLSIGDIYGAATTGETPLDVFLGQDTTICGSISIQLDALNPGSTYLWNDGSANQTLDITGPGSYWVEVTNNNCVSSDTIDIGLSPGAQVSLGNDTTLCVGTSLLLNAQNAGATFVWQDNSTNQTYTVTQAGLYSVTVNSNNCINSDSILISFDNAQLNLGPDLSICEPTTLNAGTSSGSYLWSDNSTASTLYIDVIGTYWVELTSGSCVYTDTIEVSEGSITTGLPSTSYVCAGTNAVLNANNPGASYLWNDGSTNQQLSVNNAGTYWVTVTLGFCETTDSTDLVVSDPIAFFFVIDTIGCSPLTTSFFDESTSPADAITTWLWDFGDGATSTQQNPQHSYSSSGNYTVTLTVSTANGCQSSYSQPVQIVIFPSPIAAFSFTPIDPVFGEEVFFTDESLLASSWLWSFGNGDSSAVQNPIHIYPIPGSYLISLTVSNADGCQDEHHVLLEMETAVIFYVPNAFSPDGDEFNNTFQPVFGVGLDTYNYQFSIYDRWGELIFESFDHERGWDGTFKGNMVQDGTYIWTIKFGNFFDSEVKTANGHVTILR